MIVFKRIVSQLLGISLGVLTVIFTQNMPTLIEQSGMLNAFEREAEINQEINMLDKSDIEINLFCARGGAVTSENVYSFALCE